MNVKEAAELYDEGKYAKAFSGFAGIYNNAENQEERSAVLELMNEVFYRPNAQEMQDQYEKNRESLRAYPYYCGEELPEFSCLPFRMFPITEACGGCLDLQEDWFGEIYTAQSSAFHSLFFRQLDQPLKILNQDNMRNLIYLMDNVRSSEDYGDDNHIYLAYSDLTALERLMLFCDLEGLLESRKFVFLVGEAAADSYPIDFRERFGADWGDDGPQPIRPEEVKKITYWYKHADSGSHFTLDVLDANPYIQKVGLHDFYTYSRIKGKPITLRRAQEIYDNYDKIYSIDQIEGFLRDPENDIRLAEAAEALDWAKAQWPQRTEYSMKDWFLLYFLYFYRKKNFNPRVVPQFVFDPHIWDNYIHNRFIKSFPEYLVLTCMRDPIRSVASGYIYGLLGWDEFQTKYLLASDYQHARFMDGEMMKRYFGIRFEDLKTEPEKVCVCLCALLDVPYSEEMLKMDKGATDCYFNQTKGFDTAPLHRDISSVFSEFDLFRLRLFYAPILKYYGYPYLSKEDCPIPDEMLDQLMSYPLRFEQYNHLKFPQVSRETIHEWVQTVFRSCRHANFISPVLIYRGGYNAERDEKWKEMKEKIDGLQGNS